MNLINIQTILEGNIKNYALRKVSSKDYDHVTIWETDKYPKIRISQNGFNDFQYYEDIQDLNNELSDF